MTTATNYTSEATDRLLFDFPNLSSVFIKKTFKDKGEKYTATYDFLQKIEGSFGRRSSNDKKGTLREEIQAMSPYYTKKYTVFLKVTRVSDFIENLQRNKQLKEEIKCERSVLFLLILQILLAISTMW